MNLPAETYTSSSCEISHKGVYKDDALLFENKETDLFSFLTAIYLHFKIDSTRFYKMDRLSKLGLLAASVLLQDSEVFRKYTADNIGIVLSNCSSSLDTDLKYSETIKKIASPSLFVYTLPNIMIGEICIKYGIKGETAFFISERFDADFIQHYVNNLINNNILHACICGWVELTDKGYKAILYLVEKSSTNKIYTSENE